MNDGPPSDTTEGVLRFGCGSVVGGVVAACFLSNVFADPDHSFYGMVGVGALLAGLLAVRFGDRFWRWMIWWLNIKRW